MIQFFYNIAGKKACFFDEMQTLTQRAAKTNKQTNKQTNAYVGWLQTRHNRSSSLN